MMTCYEITVTVTESLVLRPLLEDWGHITEYITCTFSDKKDGL